MAFLKENTNFPPPEWDYWLNKYCEYAAWYSGDIEEIVKLYTMKTASTGLENSVFWAKLENEERTNAVHLPAAGDIASTSSDLLFSELPKFTYNKESDAGNVIVEFQEENGFFNILLEGAELAAALTGVFLKLDIDTRISKIPIVRIITPFQAFPTFFCGRLWEILFYREVKTEKSGTVVYRLFENRKKTKDGTGMEIEFRLYKGTDKKVGKIIDLNSIEETENLNLQDKVYPKIDGLGVVYVPNRRPNKLQPGSVLGINDYSGCIPLMDSLDLSWTSLINDIELGMGQIFVDEELLQREDKNIFGTQKTLMNKFSKFQKCFLKLNFSNYRMGNDNIKPIEVSQFEMRVDEHLKACEALYKIIVSQCGYSPSTFGMDTDGRVESGTALRIRARKSFLTREKKSRYWQPGIKHLLTMMQQLYNIVNVKNISVENVGVELEDSIIVDPREQSETIRNLDQARAIATITKVKMLHPDWKDNDVEAEVKRIYDEEGIEKNSDVFDLDS